MKIGKDYSWNMEVLGGDDLGGIPGFQMGLQVVDGRSYLYISSMYATGFHILDVTDRDNIRRKYVDCHSRKPYVTTPKIQVADGNLILCLAQLPAMIASHTMPDKPLDEVLDFHNCDAGFELWDVKTDPWNPRYVSSWDGGLGKGAHRNFYNGGRYVHMTCAGEGFTNFYYRVVDIADPAHPKEISRWFHPAQENGSEAQKNWNGPIPELHMPYIKGDRAYLAMTNYGFVLLDISDIYHPKELGHVGTWPQFSSICHTAMPLTGDPNAVLVSTEHNWKKAVTWGNQKARRTGFAGIIDISDPTDPCFMSTMPYLKVPEDASWKNYIEKPGDSGPHNWHQPSDLPVLEDRPDRLYHTCFNGGLRVYDVSDPVNPKEIAYYIPGEPDHFIPGAQMRGQDCFACLEDVLVAKDGTIYTLDSNGGLIVLRCTV